MTSCIEQLHEFIDSCPTTWRPRNAWLEDRFMNVYVRFGCHYLRPAYPHKVLCLDIAVIAVKFKHWNTGHCRRFIQQAHEIHPWQATFVECANSPVLDAALPRWGYTFDGLDSYFKFKDSTVAYLQSKSDA